MQWSSVVVRGAVDTGTCVEPTPLFGPNLASGWRHFGWRCFGAFPEHGAHWDGCDRPSRPRRERNPNQRAEHHQSKQQDPLPLREPGGRALNAHRRRRSGRSIQPGHQSKQSQTLHCAGRDRARSWNLLVAEAPAAATTLVTRSTRPDRQNAARKPKRVTNLSTLSYIGTIVV